MYLDTARCYPSPSRTRNPSFSRSPNKSVEFQHVRMANIKSQKKRNRQNEKRRMRNKSVMSDLKTAIKKVENAAAAGEPTDELLRHAQKKIDTAAAKGVLHPKTAARKKSRLAASISA